MKLFAVQKRLCLDLVEISELDREFKSLPAGEFFYVRERVEIYRALTELPLVGEVEK